MNGEYTAQAELLKALVLTGDPSRLGQAPFEAALACADRLILQGHPKESLELVDSVAAGLPPDYAGYRIRLEAAALRALFAAFEESKCFERATRSLIEFAPLSSSSEQDYAQIRISQAAALHRMNRVDESLGLLSQIALELRTQPDSVALARCLITTASAHITKGDWSMARRVSLEALTSARRIGSDFLEGCALGNLCIAEKGRCRFAAAEEAGAESVAAFTRVGALGSIAHSQRSLAIALLKRGKSQTAIEVLGNSFDDKEVLVGWQLWFNKLALSMAFVHVGDATGARVLLESPFYHRGEIPESRAELLRLEYLGDIELEQGHFEAALKRYDEVLPHALALIPRGDVVAELRRRRAECLLALGKPSEADAEAKLALELCLELGDRYEEAATYRTLALAAAALKRHDEAKKHFTHGFAMYDDIETPYEWGKLWMSYGDWLAGPTAGAYESLPGAREAYRAACDHFEHMGAALKLTQARQRLAAIESRLNSEGVVEPAPGEKPRPRRRPSMDRELQRRVQWAFDTFGVVTRHKPLIEMLEQVAAVAVSDIPVLVLGESGTGKELIARGVHSLSGRTGELVEVNCSAVPTTMMESEFFGSMQGSYTGSVRDRAGLIEAAHEGSIFLDEIGEMPVDLQAKLLRFLETGEVRRIGANAGRRVDARLIAATNREAVKMQAGDGFRQDLYYRLAHAVFTLPPLRSRGDDVDLLVDHFHETFARGMRKKVALADSARDRLATYAWPGNVRQLRSLMQRLVVQTPEGRVITPRDIPLADTADAPRSFNEEMESQEKLRILEALEKTEYIKADAARMLRISRTTLLGKMKRYQIPG